MNVQISEEENRRQENRSFILAMSGFSFSAALAILAYGAATNKDIVFPAYYLFLSFICYLFALNVQSYKSFRWEDQIGSSVVDSGSFCLVLSLASMLIMLQAACWVKLFLSLLAIAVWAIDIFFKLWIWSKYFTELEKGTMKNYDKDKKKDLDDRYKRRDLDFDRCPKHGIRFPKGAKCPKCVSESKG